ncbi:MAG: DUF4438 domain-containing protein [Bacillota bacterium]
MIRYNREQLVIVSVVGEISSPAVDTPYRLGHDGVARVGAGTGGITYNVRVGDSAYGWAGDHVEPGVSSKNKDVRENNAYNFLSCIGNEARVLTGEAKGAVGVVTGKHGGIEHVIIDFCPEVLEKLAIGDKIQVKGCGQGMQLLDFPNVRVMNVSPRLLEALELEVSPEGKLRVPVTAIAPAAVMGSGMGSPTSEKGDYDITTQDREILKETGLDQVRLGDLVAIADMSGDFGRSFKRGAVTIGVVVHGDSNLAGHGPGVTGLFSSVHGDIEPFIDPGANLADILQLRGDA